MTTKHSDKYGEYVYPVARIIIGFLFACHGAQKLFGVLGGSREIHDPEGLVAGIVEFFGGSLVALGLGVSRSCISRQRRDGRGLLQSACAALLLAHLEWRRKGRILLFLLLVRRDARSRPAGNGIGLPKTPSESKKLTRSFVGAVWRFSRVLPQYLHFAGPKSTK